MPTISLTPDQIDLIHGTIVATDLDGVIRGLMGRAKPTTRGTVTLRGTDQEFDELLWALARECRAYLSLDEERAGHELDAPLPGSTAYRLSIIADKMEQLLS